jgi:hypothetical protein
VGVYPYLKIRYQYYHKPMKNDKNKPELPDIVIIDPNTPYNSGGLNSLT